MFLLPHSIVAGVITKWFSSVGSIPGGWALCDGTLGTPDLRDKFIIGAGVGFSVGDSGGGVWHNHTATTDGHSHAIGGGPAIEPGANIDAGTDTKTDTLTTDAGGNLPPYNAIVFIMFLG